MFKSGLAICLLVLALCFAANHAPTHHAPRAQSAQDGGYYIWYHYAANFPQYR